MTLSRTFFGLSLPLLTLGSALFVGCGDKGDDSGNAGDGGADGGGDGGAVEPDARDGQYRGQFNLRLIEPEGDLVDACVGTAIIQLIVNADQPIRGTSSCRFNEALAADWPDPISGVINGAIEEDGQGTGPVRVMFTKETVIENVWLGGLDEKERLDGTFVGRINLEGTEYQYSGSFNTAKVPPKKTE